MVLVKQGSIKARQELRATYRRREGCRTCVVFFSPNDAYVGSFPDHSALLSIALIQSRKQRTKVAWSSLLNETAIER